MKKPSRVNLFLLGIALVSVIFAIFALFDNSQPAQENSAYERELRAMEDTIKSLRRDVSRYKEQITQLDLERTKLKADLIQILKDYEKVDNVLTNGSLDDNVKFLSEYLSKDNIERGRYGSSSDTQSIGTDK